MNIKTTIGIIAIVLSSITIAEAGQNRHERDNDRHYQHSDQKQHYRNNHRRSYWKRARHARHDYREQRHYQKHFYGRRDRYERSHSAYSNPRYNRHSRYVAPLVHSSPRIVLSGHGHSNRALPTIAGGIIGSAIANNASHGDPAATVGGALFGAIVGNALSRH